MLKHLLCFFIFIGYFNADAQNEIYAQRFINSGADTNTVNRLAELCEKYCYSDPQKALKFGYAGVLIGQKTGYNKGVGECYFKIATALYVNGNNEKAMGYLEKAVKIFLKQGNYKKVIKCYNNIGILLYSLGEYADALKKYLVAAQMAEMFDNRELLPDLYCGIGLLYFTMMDDSTALQYFSNSLKLYEIYGNKTSIGYCKNNIGIVYSRKGGHETEALNYFKEALSVGEEMNDNALVSRVSLNIGLIYEDQKKYYKALEYYKKSLGMAGNYNDYELNFKANISISNIYLLLNNYDQSLLYAERALGNINRFSGLTQKQEAYSVLSEIYDKMGNPDLAFKYYKLFSEAKDSVFNSESKNKIIELEAKYQNKIKEKNIIALEKEKILNENEINRQKKLKYFFIIFGALTLIILGITVAYFLQRKYLNRKLSEANKQLTELNAAKDKFFTIISHDIQSPLNAFRSITKELSCSYYKMSEDAKFSYITEVYKASENLYMLFQNLLQWSISQSKIIKYNPKEIDICIIVYKTIAALEQSAAKKGIIIEANIKEETYARADPNMISTIIYNLLANAIKYTGFNGKIIISAKTEYEYLTVSVSDNGIGIEKSDLDKLFKIEFDPKTIGNSEEKGTGIGLILCKEFVKINGGKIWAESEPGEGCTFNFTLPVMHTERENNV